MPPTRDILEYEKGALTEATRNTDSVIMLTKRKPLAHTPKRHRRCVPHILLKCDAAMTEDQGRTSWTLQYCKIVNDLQIWITEIQEKRGFEPMRK